MRELTSEEVDLVSGAGGDRTSLALGISGTLSSTAAGAIAGSAFPGVGTLAGAVGGLTMGILTSFAVFFGTGSDEGSRRRDQRPSRGVRK